MKIGAIWDVFWPQYGGVHAEHIFSGGQNQRKSEPFGTFSSPSVGGYTWVQEV